MTYFYEPRRDYRDSDGGIESRHPLSMHIPQYWSVYIKEEEDFWLKWVADFNKEEDANAFCEMKNKEM